MQGASHFNECFLRQLGPPVSPQQNPGGFFRRIRERTDLPGLFGKFGERISELSGQLNLDHPGLPNIFDGDFGENGEISSSVESILQSSPILAEKGLTSIAEMAAKEFLRGKSAKRFLKSEIGARFFPDEMIDRERSQKKSSEIRLTTIIKDLRSAWDSSPSSLEMFARNSDPFEEQLVEARNRVDYYRNIGITSNAKKIAEQIAAIEERQRKRHYGFNRMKVAEAAIILAKILECRYNECGVSVAACQRIILEHRKHSKIYACRLYPLKEIGHLASRASTFLAWSDRCPDAAGHPIFDCFWVLCPSVIIPFTNPKMSEEAMRECIDYDLELIEKRKTLPILMGEVDRELYFIMFFI